MSERAKLKLEIELVPSTVWESSLYRLLPSNVWNKIRNNHIKKYGKKCEICSEQKGTHNLHEIWKYDDENHSQKLIGFVLLCRPCHHVKHIGFARILASRGKLDYDKIVEHFCKVNECTKKDFENHKHEAFKIWNERSNYEWEQNFGEYKELIKQ